MGTERLSPNTLLSLVRGSGFKIGDKVQMVSNKDGTIYQIYSYTTYKGGRVAYTIWNGNDYELVDDWQIEKVKEVKPIGFNAITNETKTNI